MLTYDIPANKQKHDPGKQGSVCKCKVPTGSEPFKAAEECPLTLAELWFDFELIKKPEGDQSNPNKLLYDAFLKSVKEACQSHEPPSYFPYLSLGLK
jgi:hypothetical protein